MFITAAMMNANIAPCGPPSIWPTHTMSAVSAASSNVVLIVLFTFVPRARRRVLRLDVTGSAFVHDIRPARRLPARGAAQNRARGGPRRAARVQCADANAGG